MANGWNLFRYSFRVFARYPLMGLPLLFTWLLYAPTILYFRYYFDWAPYDLRKQLLLSAAIIFFFASLLAFSASMLLELVQQAERGEELSLQKALGETLGLNLLRMLPIVVVWTVIWFALSVLTALFTRKKRGSSSSADNFSAENAARTLAGQTRFSFSAAFFRALNKGVRMVVFLILPAIAWQNLGPLEAVRRGLRVLRLNLGTFITGYALSELAAMVIFIPPAILFYLSGEYKLEFPQWVWSATIAYIALGWSYAIYLEQMFTATLYLWHLKWEKAIGHAYATGGKIPSMRDIPAPSLLDGVNDLEHLNDAGRTQ